MARKSKKESRKAKSGIMSRLRSNFFTGLAVVLPVALTIYMVWAFVGFVDDRVLPLIPDKYNPAQYVNIRGFGLVVFFIFTVFIGALTKGFFGRWLLKIVNNFLDSVPVVRSIYNGIKQIVETVLSNNSNNFEKACLVEYPRKGIWAIAFVSTSTKGEVAGHLGEPAMSVFLPTTPNPTSGFLLFVPEKDLVYLDMEIEEAAKLIISAGLVVPPTEAEIAAGSAKTVKTIQPPKTSKKTARKSK